MGLIVIMSCLLIGIKTINRKNELVIEGESLQDVAEVDITSDADADDNRIKENSDYGADEGVRRNADSIQTASADIVKNANIDISDKSITSDNLGLDLEVTTQIVVHVCGQVNSPGVYELKAGSRVYEAIDLAGGMTNNADISYVNQADKLEDGVKLYIPSVEETAQKEAPTEFGVTGNAKEADSSKQIVNGTRVGDMSLTGLVNINTASKDQLMTLTGVGESKANAIINYRDENGFFKTIEDIMNIRGIKEGLFNKIKDQITV